MKKLYFHILKVTEEKSRIRSWSEVRILGSRSGSAPKCHGSHRPALVKFGVLDFPSFDAGFEARLLPKSARCLRHSKTIFLNLATYL
jgi:hypothetical protein